MFDTLLSRLCSLVIGGLVIAVLLLISARGMASASPTLSSATISGNPNVVAGSMAAATTSFGQTVGSTGSALNSSLRSVTDSFGQAVDSTGSAMRGGITAAALATTQIVRFEVTGGARFGEYITQGASTATTLTVHGIGTGAASTAHATGDSFAFTGHMIGNAFGFASGVTHAGSLIRAPDHTPTPTITQMRAQQATIIQSNTIGVTAPAAPVVTGTGGACDTGESNGGYPISWCSAPMDSLPTISYSADPINRECTSYAYWYFTAVEGHTGFRVSGNAKYWATSSNYPTHAAPADGAIAVETVGAYGHVAIVQALPGQEYAGRVVPAGYVLVSEMNYDWQGHFRYSYSPLSKFTAYIYP